jgi:hypothetical protein
MHNLLCKKRRKPTAKRAVATILIVMLVTLLAGCAEPNESNIPDGKDFKEIKFQCNAQGDSISVEIEFYAPPVLNEFFLYFSTDDDADAEICVRCRPSNFEVAKETDTGLHTTVIYTSTPTVSGTFYSLELPWSQIFGSLDIIDVWLYAMDGQDHLPDTGELRFIYSQCLLGPAEDIPTASHQDPNEPGIGDGKDFKETTFLCYKEQDSIGFKVDFYAPLVLDEFFLYFSTDSDAGAEICVRCRPSNFEVATETSPGMYTTVIYTGIPFVSGKTYIFTLPWSQIFGSLTEVDVWLYAMDGQDQLPDTGDLRFTPSSCKVTLV